MDRKVVLAGIGMSVLFTVATVIKAQQDTARGLLTVGQDDQVYYIQDDTLWRWDPATTDDAVQLVDYGDLADVLGIPADDIEAADLAATSDGAVWLSVLGRGELLIVSGVGTVATALAEADITEVTGESTARPGPLATDADEALFVVEQQSGDVLVVTGSPGSYSVEVYTAGQAISNVARDAVLAELEAGTATLASQLLAQTDGAFTPTALVRIEDSSLYGDGYYITQFSNDPAKGIEGDGAVARIVPNENEPNQAVWERLFDPELADPDVAQEAFHPTALALAGPDNTGFDEKLYMANFGEEFGPQMDGKVFVVEPDGTLTEFVTE